MPMMPRPLPIALALMLAAQGGLAQDAAPEADAGPVVEAPADAGAYLAARVAESHSDFRSAAAWYDRALAADPGNAALIEGALYSRIGLGDFQAAVAFADLLGADGPAVTQLAAFARTATEAAAEDYAALTKAAATGRELGPVLDELVLGWAAFGEGRVSDALSEFDKVAEMRGMEAVGLYHKALALALAGDFEGADAILSGKAAGPLQLNRRGVLAHAEVLSQLERNADAVGVLDRAFGREAEPALDALRARLEAGEPVPFDTIGSAREGMGEAFFTIGTLLLGEADPAYVLLHSRVANFLDEGNSEALLLTAQALEDLEQHDLAVETYARFPKDSPAYYTAEIGRADALYAAGKVDAAIEALQNLTRSHAELVVAHSSLADLLRREERCAEAIAPYDAALERVGTVERVHWTLFFSRGICHEKLKAWDQAEADFRKALELNPGQPQVLNYLGYSLVDRGLKLDEALKMIEEAVAAEPEAGYIIDSLAWAYFRLGRYEEALAPMEKASLLEPVDPIVTDHLGDVYWMVGRKREAEFQWHRALSFEPEEKDAERIRRKLEVGLDQVMAEEASGAVQPSDPTAENGN